MAKRPGQRWVPRVVTLAGKKVPARITGFGSTSGEHSRKYLASRSTCKTPGFEISPLAIFSKVLRGTPLADETLGHVPLLDCSSRNTNSKIESGMAKHPNPVSGVTQPGNGFRSRIGYRPMGRPKNQPRPVRTPKDVIGEILAVNIRNLMSEVYRTQEHETARIAALASSSGVAKETIRRILARDVSPRVDNVQMLAMALGVTVGELLQPRKQSTEDLDMSIPKTSHIPQHRRGT